MKLEALEVWADLVGHQGFKEDKKMPRSQDVWNQLKQSFDVEVYINEAP